MFVFYILLGLVLWGLQAIMGAWFVLFWPQLNGKYWICVGPLILALLTVGAIIYSRTHYGWAGQTAYYLAYTWFGFVFLGGCLCIGLDILYRILGKCHVPLGWMGIFTLITLGIIWTLALWGGFSTPKIKRIALQIPNAPKMKIALLSDSHLGMGVSLKRFDRAIRRLEEEHPDVLFVLGDVFEYGPHREQYAARIQQIQPPLGIYGVFGNHEYYVGYENSKDFFQQAGITLLENSSVVLPNGLQVAGLKDIHTAQVTEQETVHLLKTLNAQKPIVLLSHTPKYADVAAEHGADLMFSGHTHNGQIWPFHYLVRLQFPYVYGLFEIKNLKFYITSGLFYWGIPLRFLSPKEIPIIEIN